MQKHHEPSYIIRLMHLDAVQGRSEHSNEAYLSIRSVRSGTSWRSNAPRALAACLALLGSKPKAVHKSKRLCIIKFKYAYIRYFSWQAFEIDR